ncbi:MAG: hypothetical protein LBG60_09900 [Bifidobacteriaceae bacterium]|jgi:hypothetical protein|nr:hypothetical protein [Bifidobacteriaceae bacterium]
MTATLDRIGQNHAIANTIARLEHLAAWAAQTLDQTQGAAKSSFPRDTDEIVELWAAVRDLRFELRYAAREMRQIAAELRREAAL